MSRRQSLLLSPVSSESQAPCGGAGKAASANSLSRCLKGQGFPELRASTWVPSAKAGTGRPIKPEPALEEAAHLWPGPAGRNPCPLQIRCSAVSAGRLFAARTPRPQSQQVPHAPHGSGESPHRSSVSDICLASAPQMTQTCIFLSRHFPDCFPASVSSSRCGVSVWHTRGPWGSSLEAGPTSVPPPLVLLQCPCRLACLPPPRSWGAWRAEGSASSPGLEQRACCVASPREATGPVWSQERVCQLRAQAWPRGQRAPAVPTVLSGV